MVDKTEERSKIGTTCGKLDIASVINLSVQYPSAEMVYKSGKVDLILGEFPLVCVECNLEFGASLQELSDMIGVLCGVVIVNDDVVHDAAVAGEACKSFIHSAVVMFGYG